MFDFNEELKKLPAKPGVYIMHDGNDAIIYVGKAINLHNRVRSYFRKNIGRGPQIDKMVTQIARFEYIITDSELEALVLENNLIKEYSPRYNTMLKDDKTYPYIKVTLGDAYPRVMLSREMKKDKSRYFGPFTSAAAVKDTIDLINKLYMLRTCNKNLPKEAGTDGKGETTISVREGQALFELSYQTVHGALPGFHFPGGIQGRGGACPGFFEWKFQPCFEGAGEENQRGFRQHGV